MNVTILVDNHTLIGRYFLGEPGLSIYIEESGKRILFDVGYSDAFLINAAKMNINLLHLDFLVFSHGHLDHTWGLAHLLKLYAEAAMEELHFNKPVVVAHPRVLLSKIFNGYFDFGSPISENKLSHHFKLQFSKNPMWLTDNLVFLGEIPRLNEFEGRMKGRGAKVVELNEIDQLLDDTALAYKSPQGLVIITGCSHSGICNITEYAKKVCEEERVIDIIGGLHLQNPPGDLLQFTLEYIKGLNLEALHACHCTDLNSIIALSQVAEVKEVGVGLKLTYD